VFKLFTVLISKEGTVKLADFGWAVYDPKPRFDKKKPIKNQVLIDQFDY
jgi:hypothetical protein